MTEAEPKTIHPLVIAGIRGLFAGLRALFAVIRAIPAADRVAFLSRQSNTPSADMLAIAAEIASRQPSVRIVMLCRNMSSHRDLGYGFHLLRQMWHVAHARTVILDSYSFLTSNGIVRPDSRVVQLWHAIGSFKKFGWSAEAANGPRRQQLARALRMHAGNTTVIASSVVAAVNFAEAFGVSPDQVAVSPLPRVDALLDTDRREQARIRVYEVLPALRGAKVLLVSPTIRSSMETDGSLERIRTAGEAAGYTVIESLHPVTNPSTTGLTSNDLLSVADAFVTDRSSMIYEAGLVGIPGFLWVPAHERTEFLTESYPTESELAPMMVATADELGDALADPARRRAAERFARDYVSVDTERTATQRIVDIVLSS